MHRDRRQGFLEKRFFPRFHLYPWECRSCFLRKLFKARGLRKRRSAAPESPARPSPLE